MLYANLANKLGHQHNCIYIYAHISVLLLVILDYTFIFGRLVAYINIGKGSPRLFADSFFLSQEDTLFQSFFNSLIFKDLASQLYQCFLPILSILWVETNHR